MGAQLPRVEKRSVGICGFCREFVSFTLRCVSYGKVRTQTSDPQGEKFSFYHRLNYIVKGEPFYYAGEKRIDLHPGCLVYLPPNAILEIDEDKPPVELLFVNFEVGALDMLDKFREFAGDIFKDQYVEDRDGELLAICETIGRIGALGQTGTGLEIQNLFENLFLHVVRMSDRVQSAGSGTAASGGNEILNRAMNYINENIHHNFRLSDMAAALNISENYLYKIFVSKTGKSPAAFITRLRMDIAKSALANPTLPIKSIAAHLGYPDVSHFSSVFKKEWGISPRAYRSRLGERLKG